MLGKELETYLNGFGKYVIQQSRSNLTKQKKNVDKNLYNSLSFEKNVSKNSFQLSFMMEDYGKFQDKGVKGKDPSKVSPNARIQGQQAPNSPYRFGSGTSSGKWGSFVNNIADWAKKRNIRLRDDKGRFKKGDYKTIAQIIASNIYARGIKPSLFFTKPFNKAFETMPDEVLQAYALDVEKFLQSTIKK